MHSCKNTLCYEDYIICSFLSIGKQFKDFLVLNFLNLFKKTFIYQNVVVLSVHNCL